jgi:hypothetical protein
VAALSTGVAHSISILGDKPMNSRQHPEKSYGAGIFCSACHSEPWPDPGSGARETFDLLRIIGEWRCELHRTAEQKRARRPVVNTPFEALVEVERLLEAESARFERALVHDRHDLLAEFQAYSSKLARGLAELRKALAPPRPTTSPDDAPNSRRPPKKIKANERLGTVDWLAGDAQPAGEDSP